MGMTGYYVMRGIGRLAFPLFLYFLVQGIHYTRSKPKYFLRIGILAIISEVPYDMYFYKGFPNWAHQNIFFELFACLLLIEIFERVLPCNRGGSCNINMESKQRLDVSDGDGSLTVEPDFCPAYIVFFTAIMCIPAYFLHFSYGFKGIIATAFLYKYNQEREQINTLSATSMMTREGTVNRNELDVVDNVDYALTKHRIMEIIYLILACASLIVTSTKIQYACLAVIPFIYFCEVKFEKQNRLVQLFTYLFYPVHILLLYFIGTIL